MVFSCVAANCTNKASLKDGISLHTIPFFNDDRADFIKAKRVFEPSKSSTVCSDHFKPEDFERRFFMLPGQTKPNYQKVRTDSIGICVFPSIHATPKPKNISDEQQKHGEVTTPRSRRMVSRVFISFYP